MDISKLYQEALASLPDGWTPTTGPQPGLPANHVPCELLFPGGGTTLAELVSNHRGGRYWGCLAYDRWHRICSPTNPVAYRVLP